MSNTYTVITEKEYYPLSAGPTIGLLMMVKNEGQHMLTSLRTVVNVVDAVIIYDTGSTDNTIEVIQNFCQEHKINLYLIQGTFVDFSTSRNVSLAYAEKINVHYLLLLDSSDELRGGNELKEFAKEMYTQVYTGFLTCQQWLSGQMDKYYNVRFIKNRTNWKYRGSVHEWIVDTTTPTDEPVYPIFRMLDNIVLYQDRTKDGGKSEARFSRDKELLLNEYKSITDKSKHTYSRSIFYLAQTCECLGHLEEALYYSKLRLSITTGFEEELFHSYMRCANVSQKLGHDWDDVAKWYIKAYEDFDRAEPLVRLAEHYMEQKKWSMAYMFIRQACELSYPTQLILFVDNGVYEYYRWHVMAFVASWVGKIEEGKKACLIAIEKSPTEEKRKIGQDMLKYYLDKEKDIVEIDRKDGLTPVTETKQQFFARVINELKQQYPNLPAKNLHTRVTSMWKKQREKLKGKKKVL